MAELGQAMRSLFSSFGDGVGIFGEETPAGAGARWGFALPRSTPAPAYIFEVGASPRPVRGFSAAFFSWANPWGGSGSRLSQLPLPYFLRRFTGQLGGFAGAGLREFFARSDGPRPEMPSFAPRELFSGGSPLPLPSFPFPGSSTLSAEELAVYGPLAGLLLLG
jgi:hypothetical protein